MKDLSELFNALDASDAALDKLKGEKIPCSLCYKQPTWSVKTPGKHYCKIHHPLFISQRERQKDCKRMKNQIKQEKEKEQ